MIEITYRRNARQRSAILCPAGADGEKKAGLYIRDTAAGIGTVTYILPESGISRGWVTASATRRRESSSPWSAARLST